MVFSETGLLSFVGSQKNESERDTLDIKMTLFTPSTCWCTSHLFFMIIMSSFCSLSLTVDDDGNMNTLKYNMIIYFHNYTQQYFEN